MPALSALARSIQEAFLAKQTPEALISASPALTRPPSRFFSVGPQSALVASALLLNPLVHAPAPVLSHPRRDGNAHDPQSQHRPNDRLALAEREGNCR
eukprot:227366-Prymnesium_polylepis.2